MWRVLLAWIRPAYRQPVCLHRDGLPDEVDRRLAESRSRPQAAVTLSPAVDVASPVDHQPHLRALTAGLHVDGEHSACRLTWRSEASTLPEPAAFRFSTARLASLQTLWARASTSPFSIERSCGIHATRNARHDPVPIGHRRFLRPGPLRQGPLQYLGLCD